MLDSWKEVYDNIDSVLKIKGDTLLTKVWLVKAMVSSSPVQMWELDHKKGWMPKNWCLQIVVLEKILENPLDTKEIKLVNLKGNQYWILIGKTVAETEAPIFCPPVEDSWLVGKDPDAGKDWRQKEKGTAEVETVG